MTRFNGFLALVALLGFSTMATLSFAGDDKKEEKTEKGGHVVVFSDDKKEEKQENKGGHVVFADDQKDEKKDGSGK